MKILKAIGLGFLLQFVLYLIQYVGIPYLYIPHPGNQVASTIIICVTSIIVGFFGFYFLMDRSWYWILSIPFYPLLVKMYHPKNIYGIGYDGYLISLHENIGIFVWSVVVLLIQLIEYLIIKNLIKR
jgi:hypothetical protein